jgi:hypothetical protein
MSSEYVPLTSGRSESDGSGSISTRDEFLELSAKYSSRMNVISSLSGGGRADGVRRS